MIYKFIYKLYLVILVVLLHLSSLYAQKVDEVILLNGNNITCEIKGLEFGLLECKTDDMGTIQIEWEKIEKVFSNQYFEVEVNDGRIFYGTLDTLRGTRDINVKGFVTSKILSREFVVRIAPIKDSFWKRLRGIVSLGINFTKASSIKHLNIGADITYQTTAIISSLDINSIITEDKDKKTSRKQDLEFDISKILNNRFNLVGTIMLEQNTELGLNLRTSLGGGASYSFLKTNHNQLLFGSGLRINKESYTGGTANQNNLELLISSQYRQFVYVHPRISLLASLNFIPNLTNFGRIRSNFDINLDWEIIFNLYWEVNFYFTFDNKPQSTNASTTDYGIRTSFKYDFK